MRVLEEDQMNRVRKLSKGLVLGAALSALSIQGALAESAEPSKEVNLQQAQATQQQRDVENQQKALEEQRRAREASRGVTNLPTVENVTFQDVLKNPDNVDLNFRYAKAQVARGDVKGAAGTLERILLIAPDLQAIRLFYAIVLYRLDSINEAEREFLTIKKLKLEPNVEAEVDRYLSEINLRRKTTRYRVIASAGVHYDSNKTGGSRTSKAFAGGFLGDLTGVGLKRRDVGIVGSLTGEATIDMGLQSRHEFLMSATYFHDEQIAVDQQDVQALTFKAGPRLRYRDLIVTPQVGFTRLNLSREYFYSDIFVNVDAEWKNFLPSLHEGLDSFVSFKALRDYYAPIAENSVAATTKPGSRVDLEVGIKYKFNERHLVSLSGTTIYKSAQSGFESFNALKATFKHTWLLGEGAFLLTNLSVEGDNYSAVDPSIVDREREDRKWRARLTYGSPLSRFIPHESFIGSSEVYNFLKDLTWTASFEIYDQSSNIPNFSYQNRRFDTMLTKIWNF